jgi:hypothetical protein
LFSKDLADIFEDDAILDIDEVIDVVGLSVNDF